MDTDTTSTPDGPASSEGLTPSPAGRRPMAIAAWISGLLAPVVLGWGVLLGLLGMVLGSGAHLKGDRWGMPAAVVSGITCIIAMTLVFLTR
jgi:hypothetical protein